MVEIGFWQQRWREQRIGFHVPAVNEALVRWWPTLGLAPGSRVLVPLCGKSLDLWWLRDAGHEVVGVELSDLACEQVFTERGAVPHVALRGPHVSRTVPGLTVLKGDFFALKPAEPFDAVWDRAALIALPPDLRLRYVARMAKLLSPSARGLLVTLEYDQTQRQGPPWAVMPDEVRSGYGRHFAVDELTRAPEAGGEERLRRWGLAHMDQVVWRLRGGAERG